MRLVVRCEIKTLLHSEWEILISLIRNQCKSVKQTSLCIFKHFSKFFKENSLTFFFILCCNMGFNSKSRKVNCMECKVTSTSCLFSTIDITNNSSSTTHSRNGCIFNEFFQLQLISRNFFNFPIIALTYIILINKLIKLLILHWNNCCFIFTTNLNTNSLFKNFNFLSFILDVWLIEGAIDLYKVRIESTSKTLNRLEIQIIVRIFWILCVTFHQLEN